MPRAGGSYEYLRTIYGPRGGRFLSFLYIWQLSFSAPLSIASGCVGLAQYAGFLWPDLRKVYFSYQLPIPVPFVHTLPLSLQLGPATVLAMACCAIAAMFLYRNIQSVTRFSGLLWVGVMGAMAAVIGDRTAAFPLEVGVRVPSRRLCAFEWILYRAGGRAADRDLRLLGRVQHQFSRGGSARPGADDSAGDCVVGRAGGGAVSAVECQRAGDHAVAGTYRPGGDECSALRGRRGGATSVWAVGGADSRAAGGVDGLLVGVCAAAGLLAGALCGGAR